MNRSSQPIEAVYDRLHVVHGRPPAFRARCPAHQSHRGTLAVRERADGAVLLHCHAGCSLRQIVCAIGLELRDLFPPTDAWRDQQAQIVVARQRFRQAPRATVRTAITRELERVRKELIALYGYARPLRSVEINLARTRVAKIYGVALAPIRPFAWECPPHDDDPAWKTLFERRLREVLIGKWNDPERAPSPGDIDAAATLAAQDLHELASHRGNAR